MKHRHINLIIIAIVVALVVLIDLPQPPTFVNNIFKRQMKTTLGLDLTGGVQVLLQPPAGFAFTASQLQDAAKILENRTNALGVAEINFQIAGGQYILAEFPDVKNQDQVNSIIQETGLLEIVGSETPFKEGDTIQTDFTPIATSSAGTVTPSSTETAPLITNPISTPVATIYHTVITGADFNSVAVASNPNNPTLGIYIDFTLKPDGAKKFADYTTAHVNQYVFNCCNQKCHN
jgi:preprotein translocase subunit SecD